MFRPKSIGARGVWAVVPEAWSQARDLLAAEGAVFGKLLSGNPIGCINPRGLAAGGVTVVLDVTACGVTGSEALRHGATLTYVAREGHVLVASARGREHAAERLLWEQSDEPLLDDLLAQELEDHVRWSRASDVAHVVASYLSCHPAVCEVRYPGLAGDPSNQPAADILRDGFGPWLDWGDAGGTWHRVTCLATDDAHAKVLELEGTIRRSLCSRTIVVRR